MVQRLNRKSACVKHRRLLVRLQSVPPRAVRLAGPGRHHDTVEITGSNPVPPTHIVWRYMPQKSDSSPPKKTEYTGDWKEMPRCRVCTHRRIFHFRGIAGNSGKGVTREIPVRCSIPGCGCPTYNPVDEERVDAKVVGADLAHGMPHLTEAIHEADTEGA